MESSIISESNQLPENFSWATAPQNRSYGCKIKIRDQANCASDWAISVVSAFGDRLCLSTKGKINVPLSSNLVLGCDKDNHGCFGGYMRFAYNFLQKHGTITGGEFDSMEGCQPYSIRSCGFLDNFPCVTTYSLAPKCKNGTCTNKEYRKKKETTFYRIHGHILFSNATEAKKEIYKNGPITSLFDLFDDFLAYKKGVYIHTYGGQCGEHVVRVIGWGVENGEKYWHATNSWGEKWGNNGYFKILRGTRTSHCYFENEFRAVNVNHK